MESTTENWSLTPVTTKGQNSVPFGGTALGAGHEFTLAAIDAEEEKLPPATFRAGS